MRTLVVAGIVLFVVAILVIAGAYTFAKPSHHIALGAPVRQDDFVYTATAVGRTPAIANQAAHAKADGMFYIVTIHVDNNAKRVSFRWDEKIPHIVDGQGHRFEFSRAGQAALDADTHPRFSIPAGSSASYQAVFDVPADIASPVLVFDNGIMMGDIFNLSAYRRVGVMLYQ